MAFPVRLPEPFLISLAIGVDYLAHVAKSGDMRLHPIVSRLVEPELLEHIQEMNGKKEAET
ncbi:hypothetical protein [uncultured Pelagimonas sp.]|uniref:hypothetical protein n=1 Tax=uncultured Pelagimonas sp. TaxID=1618102 RepID=UPI0026035E47|nr:hypothetical protein [uncultured Pelagimonas sp.]